MAALLEVKGLKAFYGQTQVLFDLGFDIAEGGITTLLGANGAGKTTTLRAICNMVRTEGSIRFAGQDIIGRPTEEIVRQRIAHVPEGRGTFTTLTVDENLAMGAFLRKDKDGVAQDLERVFGYFPRLRERQTQLGGLCPVEQAGKQPRVGLDAHRALGAIGRGHQAQAAALVFRGEVPLLIARGHAALVRHDPDLQEMGGTGPGVVELAVHHARAGAHALHIPWTDHAAVADAVLVRKFTFQHIADDFHVAMAVFAETGARRDAVFIDDTQIAETHVRRIVIVGKRERVVALQPAVVGVTAFL